MILPYISHFYVFALLEAGWVHAHNSLRDEMRKMIEALEATKARGSVKAWESVAIKSFWASHFSHIHSHHANEDIIFVPFLKTRFKYPDKVSPLVVASLLESGVYKSQPMHVLFLFNTYISSTLQTTRNWKPSSKR
jgi:hypothetical protein